MTKKTEEEIEQEARDQEVIDKLYAEIKLGRPVKFEEEFSRKLLEHGMNGYPMSTFGPTIGVTEKTIYNWLNATEEDGTPKYPTFLQSKKACNKLHLKWYVEKGKKAIEGKIEGFNNGTFVWFGKNLFGWKDKQEIVTIDETLKRPEDMDDDEISERIAHALKVVEAHGPSK
jgi:hypothetical protein